MNTAYWLTVFLPFLLLFYILHEQKKEVLINNIIFKNRKDTAQMLELAKKFIDKECLIYTYNSQLTGTIKEVTDSAILIDNGKEEEIVNLNFVTRIREYPRNKNGKKKSVVF